MALTQGAKVLSHPTANNRFNQLRSMMERGDYITANPKLGVELGYNEVIVNADFQYSMSSLHANNMLVIDREGKQVVYFTVENAVSVRSVFKAYRYSETDPFIFEPAPIAPPFLREDEAVRDMTGAGTEYAVLMTRSKNGPSTNQRWLLAKTNGSSLPTDWTLFADLTNYLYSGMLVNFSLVTINGKDYVLRARANADVIVDVFDANMTLLRSATLLNFDNDVCRVDQTANGRINGSLRIGYNMSGVMPDFAWNPKSETIHFMHDGHYYTNHANGLRTGQHWSMSTAHSMPASWIANGIGEVSDLAPILSTGYRYHLYSDSTWNIFDATMSPDHSSSTNNVVVDDATGDLHVMQNFSNNASNVGHWRRRRYVPGQVAIGLNNASTNGSTNIAIPEGSPYGKGFIIDNFFIVGNKYYFVGISNKHGSVPMVVNSKPGVYETLVRENDTVAFDPTKIILSPFSGKLTTGIGSNFHTIVRNGNPIYVQAIVGREMMEAYEDGDTISWRGTGVTVPTVPATLQGPSGIHTNRQVISPTWNGDKTNPVFWALMKTPTYFCIIRHQAGAWSVVAENVGKSQIDSGNASRGDQAYSHTTMASNHMLTESGRLLLMFSVPVPGGTIFALVTMNIHTLEVTTTAPSSRFADEPNLANANNPAFTEDWWGNCFGYHPQYGYYVTKTSKNRATARIFSSRDPKGVGAALTEDEWYTRSKGMRYQTFIVSKASVGLVAYLSSFPVFLGGYYSNIPQSEIVLKPNTDNYIYVERGPNGRSDLQVTTDTLRRGNTSNRLCIAKVTTAEAIITSSETYAVDGSGFPDQEGRAHHLLFTDGKQLYWRSPDDLFALMDPTYGDTVTISLQEVRRSLDGIA